MMRMDTRKITPDQKAIGEALKTIIKARDLKQEDVARAAGVPTRTYLRYLAGQSAMPAAALLRTAPALGMSTRELAEALGRALGITPPGEKSLAGSDTDPDVSTVSEPDLAGEAQFSQLAQHAETPNVKQGKRRRSGGR